MLYSSLCRFWLDRASESREPSSTSRYLAPEETLTFVSLLLLFLVLLHLFRRSCVRPRFTV
jgi:hypothetical protein